MVGFSSRDRRDYSSSGGHYGGHRGGRGGYGRGGGGRHNYSSQRQPYHGRRGGRGGQYQRGHFSGGRSQGPRGNRFMATDHAEAKDPKEEMFQSLVAMIHAVGSTTNLSAGDNKEEEKAESVAASTTERRVVGVQVGRIQQLTQVLVGSNTNASSTIWFQYEDAVDPSSHSPSTLLTRRVGPLAASLVETVRFSPVQGPCLAALTLSLHGHYHASDSSTSANNDWLFSHRVFALTMANLGRDLDMLLLVDDRDTTQEVEIDTPRIMVRLRLTLQYLVLLAKVGMVQSMDEKAASAAMDAESIGTGPMSLAGLLRTFVAAAEQAWRTHQNQPVAGILAMAVLNTIILLNNVPGFSLEWIQDCLVDPLEALLHSYKSNFAPGIGRTAILLQADQRDDVGDAQGDMTEEEEDDDEEEDEEVGSSQVCDSLQDLMRSVTHWIKMQKSENAQGCVRFAPFSDEPWQALKIGCGQSQDGADESNGDASLLQYSHAAVKLDVYPACKSLDLLLGSGAADDGIKLASMNLDGLVFGRLPIFGPPADLQSDDDDDDMEDEATATSSNVRLDAYKKEFGLIDRYFIAQAARDIVLMHESCVTPVGIERGGAKAVAEMIWSLSSMVTGEEKGMEYLILETLLSLVVQASPVSPFRQMYVCRVILELTRLAPSTVSPAIALAVWNLFKDYMPALVPTARYNLSLWLAFHLTNTDYQWPTAYWKYWEQFVLFGWGNSRGAFVKSALALMAENLSQPEVLITKCLPDGSALIDHIFETPLAVDHADTHPCQSFIDDISSRMWDNSEDASLLLSYLVGEELSESISGLTWGEYSRDRSWFRLFILWKAAAAPINKEFAAIQQKILAVKAGDSEIVMDEDIIDDSLSKMNDILRQYKETFVGVLGKDAEDQGADAEAGSLYLVKKVCDATAYSRALQSGVLAFLQREQIISTTSVVKWSLGDGTEGTPNTAALRWWQIASTAIQAALAGPSTTSEMAIETMDVAQEDSEQAAHKTRASDLLHRVEPLLLYIIQRVCTLIPLKDNGSSRLSSEQVDLVEGLKSLVLTVKASYLDALGLSQSDNSKKRSEAEQLFHHSSIVRQAMESLGIDSGNATAGLLHCWKILEHI